MIRHGSAVIDFPTELEIVIKALGDRHRLRIINMLLRADGEAVCVCEFVPELGLTQPTISYHLKQLREVGLLERERRGSFPYYRLVPGALDRVQALLAGPPLREAV